MKRLIILLVLLSVVFASCSFGMQGNNGVTVSGDESTSGITIGLDGSVLRGALADSGNATGSGNWLTIAGAGNVTTSASGSAVVISYVGGSGSPDMSLSEGHLFIGNSSGLAEDMALSGDATLNGLGEIDVAWADESQTADTANSATDSDKLDGLHGSSYLLGNATAVDSNLFAGLSAAQWATLIDTYALADIDTMDITGDTGTASPASQVVHVIGKGSVSTAAGGHTITITGATIAGGLVSILSTTVRNSNDTERSSTALSYTKKKETRLNASLRAVRVSFDLHGTATSKAYGKVYVNGVAVGSEHNTSSTTYVTYTEDLSVGYVSGDLIQVYIYTASGANAAYVRNFRLEYDAAITEIGAYTLQTSLACTADPTISVTNQDP